MPRAAGDVSLESVTHLSLAVDTRQQTLGSFVDYLPNLVSLDLSGSHFESLRDIGTSARNVVTVTLTGTANHTMRGSCLSICIPLPTHHGSSSLWLPIRLWPDQSRWDRGYGGGGAAGSCREPSRRPLPARGTRALGGTFCVALRCLHGSFLFVFFFPPVVSYIMVILVLVCGSSWVGSRSERQCGG